MVLRKASEQFYTLASVKGTIKEEMIRVLYSAALTERRLCYVFKEQIVTQATAVCSKACMEQLTSSAAAIEILWDLFSVSV